MKKFGLVSVFLIVAIVISVGVAGFFILNAQDTTTVYAQKNELAIPPLIDSRTANHHIELDIQDSAHEFFPDITSSTKGFSQSYLGPTIRLYKGETTRISFNNTLGEPTTVHGHGLHVDGHVDGGPQSKIMPAETKTVALPIVQQAGTSWYHPHLMGKTAEHVHAGLAGLYLIEDENSQSLPLPKDYGLNDIPLIVQDRTFINYRMQPHKTDNSQILDGLREKTLVVNGVIGAYHKVPSGWVRLRILNGSNARFYRFFFSENVPFFKIATEGGFLDKPVKLTEITMSPGERNEIMIDLSNRDVLALMAEFLPADPEDVGVFSSLPIQPVVELHTDKTLSATGGLPDKLNTINSYNPEDVEIAIKRSIHLEMDMADDNGAISETNQFSINGAPMRMDKINERVKKGDLELWTITSEMMPHPFHIHGVSFLILHHNGQPPAEADRGWKDTLIVSGVPSQVLMRFHHTATEEYPYMYHCHILEHEDAGMMGQFTVAEPA